MCSIKLELAININISKKTFPNSPNKIFYPVATYHGRFEMQNMEGKHLCEVDFDLRQTSGPDTSGKHDLNV